MQSTLSKFETILILVHQIEKTKKKKKKKKKKKNYFGPLCVGAFCVWPFHLLSSF
jgi:hypothetical protein